MTRTVDLVAPLVALAEAGIPTDIQELLVQGDPARGNQPAARIHMQGHAYVPESELAALRQRIEELERALERIASCQSHHPDDVVAIARAALGRKA